MKPAFITVAAMILIGCSHRSDDQTQTAASTPPALPPGQAKAGPQDGIAPVGGVGAGPMTPVVGGENIGGTSGGGVNQVASAMARKAAQQESARPGDQTDGGGGQ